MGISPERVIQGSAGDFRIREAVTADVPALAALHVKTWNETYPQFADPPTYRLRLINGRKYSKILVEAGFACLLKISGKSRSALPVSF